MFRHVYINIEKIFDREKTLLFDFQPANCELYCIFEVKSRLQYRNKKHFEQIEWEHGLKHTGNLCKGLNLIHNKVSQSIM